MSETFKWCMEGNRLKTFDKLVFCFNLYGDKHWYLNGKSHRENGPAVEDACGVKYWYLNDKLHRENGPAIEHDDGSAYWYLNGKLHRVGGPAIECTNAGKRWYLDGIGYSESDYWKELQK